MGPSEIRQKIEDQEKGKDQRLSFQLVAKKTTRPIIGRNFERPEPIKSSYSIDALDVKA